MKTCYHRGELNSSYMSESQSPPPEDHDLELTHGDVDDDDDGISTDTSGSIPGSPGAEEDGDIVTICRWDGCNRDLKTLDALVRHVHDCMFPSVDISCCLYGS